jgi:hypothetical protein
MVDGGTLNGRTITGIGTTKSAKIEYRALTIPHLWCDLPGRLQRSQPIMHGLDRNGRYYLG